MKQTLFIITVLCMVVIAASVAIIQGKDEFALIVLIIGIAVLAAGYYAKQYEKKYTITKSKVK